MTRYPRLAGVGTVLGLVAILSACVGAGAPSHASTPATAGSTASGRPAQSVPPLATVPPSGEAVTGEVPAGILDRIVADAAVRAGTDPAEITVIRGESVTWPDGSLGCPEPGMMYTQALVDGYHVVVDAGGAELDYRVGSGGGLHLCEGTRPGG